jgi:hypothetical protein
MFKTKLLRYMLKEGLYDDDEIQLMQEGRSNYTVMIFKLIFSMILGFCWYILPYFEFVNYRYCVHCASIFLVQSLYAFLGFGEDLEQEASYTEGWGMDANSSFEESPDKSVNTSSRARKRKSSPLTVVITKKTKTDIKEEALSESEEESQSQLIKPEPLDEEEEEEEESGHRRAKDSEFVARLPRVKRVKSEEVGDDECYQLRGWRSGRRYRYSSFFVEDWN